MQDARNADSWEPAKADRFRRNTATIAFTEAATPAGLMDRIAPAMLGVMAGGGLATIAWLWLGWFRG